MIVKFTMQKNKRFRGNRAWLKWIGKEEKKEI